MINAAFEVIVEVYWQAIEVSEILYSGDKVRNWTNVCNFVH